MKELLKKADDMERAFSVLLTGLATDGNAIEGFVAAVNARHDYINERLKHELTNISTQKMPEIVTTDRLIKILDDVHLLEAFYKELKDTDDVSRAVWYTLRDADTNKALRDLKSK